MLELLLAVLGGLLNLSTLPANQPRVARRGLTTLLSANTSLYTAVMDLVGWRVHVGGLPVVKCAC